jgi:hypothetical protein
MSGTGMTTITTAGDLVISGNSGRTIDARTLNLQGTTVWTGNGSISLQNGATINNSASFLVQGDPSLFSNGGAPNFNNSGTFTKNGGAALFNDTVPFNNTGGVVVQSGQFRLSGGGTSSGTFNVGTGAAVEFNSNYTLNTGTAVAGAGFTRLTNATTTVAGNVSAENFELAGGTIGGPGTLTITDQFNWTSGGMNGTGMTTVPAGSDLTISTTVGRTIDARTLNLQGTTVWSGNGASACRTERRSTTARVSWCRVIRVSLATGARQPSTTAAPSPRMAALRFSTIPFPLTTPAVWSCRAVSSG